MIRKPLSKEKTFDWITLSVYISLVIIGWFMVFSTLYDANDPYTFLDIRTQIGAQTAWLILSIFAFIATLTLDWKFWNTLAFPIYAVSIIFLILVIFVGKEINGAKSWFSFGFISFQPSEWAKVGTALALSSYLSFFKTSITNTNTLAVSMALFLTPALLILLQPDFGSALIFASFFILLYRRGLSSFIFVLGIGLAAIFILSLMYGTYLVATLLFALGVIALILEREAGRRALFVVVMFMMIFVGSWFIEDQKFMILPPLLLFIFYSFLQIKNTNFKLVGVLLPVIALSILFSYTSSYTFDNFLRPHQQERVNVWLRPEKCDPRGSLYNITQSKLAIGSGGFYGKGYLKGQMTKLNYVPEQTTDFIFTSIGEEQGFIGSVGVIILFSILLIRCIIIAERANLEFIRNYGYAVAGILFLHFAFNIGMTMGLMPVIGIPLPFISKGGSSLMAFSVMVAILIKMDKARYRSN